MQITLLGTGTPAPSLARQSSGLLIHAGRDLIVMDHGPGAHHRLIESGHRDVDVTHVFLSHLHYDHCMDCVRLVLQRWDMGADVIPDLEVYGPAPAARMTDLLFAEDGVFGPDIRARIEHPSSIDVFRARGGQPPRRRPAPQVREVRPGTSSTAMAGRSRSNTPHTYSRSSSALLCGWTRSRAPSATPATVVPATKSSSSRAAATCSST